MNESHAKIIDLFASVNSDCMYFCEFNISHRAGCEFADRSGQVFIFSGRVMNVMTGLEHYTTLQYILHLGVKYHRKNSMHMI